MERLRWQERISLPLSSPARVLTVERTFSLDCGENLIEVVAYNAKGLIASAPTEISVKWDGLDPLKWDGGDAIAAKVRDPTLEICDRYDGRLKRSDASQANYFRLNLRVAHVQRGPWWLESIPAPKQTKSVVVYPSERILPVVLGVRRFELQCRR